MERYFAMMLALLIASAIFGLVAYLEPDHMPYVDVPEPVD
jgi:hypothetical protein